MEMDAMVSITPQMVKKILSKYGTEVTLEEAEKILSFLTTLASISLEQVKSIESNPTVCRQ
jgi:uncharacterized protein (DUF697 family)